MKLPAIITTSLCCVLCGCSSVPARQNSSSDDPGPWAWAGPVHPSQRITCRVVRLLPAGFFDDEAVPAKAGDLGGAELLCEVPDVVRGLRITLHFGLRAPKDQIRQIEPDSLISFSASVPREPCGSSFIIYVGQDGLSGFSREKESPNQRPDGTSAKAPPSKPSQGAAVPHP